MKYEKPEVVVLGSASSSVQTANKPHPRIWDNELGDGYTAPAYEADE
jgi:hypothetical protein